MMIYDRRFFESHENGNERKSREDFATNSVDQRAHSV